MKEEKSSRNQLLSLPAVDVPLLTRYPHPLPPPQAAVPSCIPHHQSPAAVTCKASHQLMYVYIFLIDTMVHQCNNVYPHIPSMPRRSRGAYSASQRHKLTSVAFIYNLSFFSPFNYHHFLPLCVQCHPIEFVYTIYRLSLSSTATQIHLLFSRHFHQRLVTLVTCNSQLVFSSPSPILSSS